MEGELGLRVRPSERLERNGRRLESWRRRVVKGDSCLVFLAPGRGEYPGM